MLMENHGVGKCGEDKIIVFSAFTIKHSDIKFASYSLYLELPPGFIGERKQSISER